MPKDTYPVPGIYGSNLQTPCYLGLVENAAVSQIIEYRSLLLVICVPCKASASPYSSSCAVTETL